LAAPGFLWLSLRLRRFPRASLLRVLRHDLVHHAAVSASALIRSRHLAAQINRRGTRHNLGACPP
jgi:hypothetical protein